MGNVYKLSTLLAAILALGLAAPLMTNHEDNHPMTLSSKSQIPSSVKSTGRTRNPPPFGLHSHDGNLENVGHSNTKDFTSDSAVHKKVHDKDQNQRVPMIEVYGVTFDSPEASFASTFESSRKSAEKLDKGSPTSRREPGGMQSSFESLARRSARSVPEASLGKDRNDLGDLEGQEAKMFRPLFVYRKQVADRYRVPRTRNPIYGAYQYGNERFQGRRYRGY